MLLLLLADEDAAAAGVAASSTSIFPNTLSLCCALCGVTGRSARASSCAVSWRTIRGRGLTVGRTNFLGPELLAEAAVVEEEAAGVAVASLVLDTTPAAAVDALVADDTDR